MDPAAARAYFIVCLITVAAAGTAEYFGLISDTSVRVATWVVIAVMLFWGTVIYPRIHRKPPNGGGNPRPPAQQ